MGRLNHIFPSLISDVVPGPNNKDLNSKHTSVNYQMSSTMRTPIFWRNALGIVVCEPSTVSTTADEYFYIKIEYEFDPGVKIDARELLSELELPDNHVERKGIVDALYTLEHEPMWYNQRKFSYTLGISREDLEKVGGVVYLNDVDLVIGFEKHRDAVAHPFSQPGQRQRLNESFALEEGLTQRYLMVDNSGIYGQRWVNTGYDVFELKSVSDPQLRDGVYVTTRSSINSEPETVFYEYADAEKALGLYRNRAEAESFGSPEARFKAELKEAEHDLSLEKIAVQKHKQEITREQHELDAERKRQDDHYKEEDARRKREQERLDQEVRRHKEDVERQRERMEMERNRIEFERQTYSERQKFEYDMRSRDRKDETDQWKSAVEVGKLFLSVVGVGLGLAALIVKRQK
jgi:hypothetical protein